MDVERTDGLFLGVGVDHYRSADLRELRDRPMRCSR
jgi:hypothetical protein